MPTPVLDLTARWNSSPKVKINSENIKLGDRYNLLMPIGLKEIDEIWEVESPSMPPNQALATKQALDNLAGSEPFQWSPSGAPPLHEYRCKSWKLIPSGREHYRITGTFERYESKTYHTNVIQWPEAQCPPLEANSPLVLPSGYSSSIVSPQGRTGLAELFYTTSLEDDVTIPIPDVGFDLYIYGVNYRSSLYVSSNSYISFGSYNNQFVNFSATNPGPGLFVGAADRAWGGAWAGSSGPGAYRIRWEGREFNAFSTPIDQVWEVTFFRDGVIMLVTGNLATTGYPAITGGVGNTASGIPLMPNSSWAFLSTGNTYAVASGSYTL